MSKAVSSGDKYLRHLPAEADIYDILVAYNVLCPARQHAIKKLLCAGLRGKASEMQDILEAADAISRAITLHQNNCGLDKTSINDE